MPTYKHATYAGETVVLENPALRLEMHKRVTGWGWGEIYTPQGKCMGILDHLGELMLRDQEIPMRLEAPEVRRAAGDFGQRLVFQVQSLIVKDKLRGTSFEPWMNYPLDLHCMVGEVTITLDPEQPLLYLSYRLVSKVNSYARYVRGPWLKAGEGSFGADRTDAIFPGLEWLEGKEWSSGTDWFKDPWAMRFIPHPNKMAIPVLALSHGGTGIGLAWDPNRQTTGWFNYRRHLPQPVFASPNFIDRFDNHLLGLMAPDVEIEALENKPYAEPPLELHLDQRVEFDAEIFLAQGSSLDVIVDWVRRHGLPKTPDPRWPLPEALERIAGYYNTNLWHPERGFGTDQTPRGAHPVPPAFAERFLEENPASPQARALQARIAWCQAQPGYHPRASSRLRFLAGEEALKRGNELLSVQRADGSFPFDPDGKHYTKDDFVVARTYLEPMGLPGDTALDITILPALELLRLAETAGDDSARQAFREASRKALDYCLPMQRPEGGDYWETPLHAPNLLAAGHAAVAYYVGYRAFDDDRYKEKAIHWIRTLLPFTHLWSPAKLPMMYNTKPCLCSSDWYFANWVRDHVQWEVLETFLLSHRLGIDWGMIDLEIDWRRFHKGVTVAAMRWMLDHTDNTWRPHNIPTSLELYRKGLMDGCFADTHNTTTGNYGGAGIMPDAIALNIQYVMEYPNWEAL
jgi:hypothetical protein